MALTAQQRYSIASTLATQSLLATVQQLNKHLTGDEQREAVRFAQVANAYYTKRDGFIPKAVQQLCK